MVSFRIGNVSQITFTPRARCSVWPDHLQLDDSGSKNLFLILYIDDADKSAAAAS
jgi:hypothetical protein